jgi:hypothetical protein
MPSRPAARGAALGHNLSAARHLTECPICNYYTGSHIYSTLWIGHSRGTIGKDGLTPAAVRFIQELSEP